MANKMGRILVCPPDYFGIEYEINPWMRVSDATDSDTSKAQWHNLARVLEEDVGVKLERMTPIKGLPDLVFTANAGVLHDGKAVISRSGIRNDKEKRNTSNAGSGNMATT